MSDTIVINARCIKPCTIQLNKREEYEDGTWGVQEVSVLIRFGSTHILEWSNDIGAFTIEIGDLWGLVDFPTYYRHFEDS